ncbi:MAG: LuxR C-terminal-related transcriptional regulator [Parasphingorhabdus sp.]
MSQADKLETQASTTWFSKSKTRAPRFFIPLVERSRLVLALDAALDKSISCIVAPAGFGKSTLLSQWRDSLIARDIPCAWVNLDENDTELRWFFAYLVFAFEDAGVSLGYLKKAAESGFVDMSSSTITASLFSAIIDIEGHMVLFLDDYHRVDSYEIGEFVRTLSDQCGDKIHIAIGSRTPVNVNLPTLMAAGQAIEIPSANLRFSDQEVREAMGDDLDEETFHALQKQLEGWPVAVQMTRLLGTTNGLAASKARARIAGYQGHLAHYLVTNVLQSQSEELRTFILETCILKGFNVELANTVCNHANSRSLIQQLDSLQALVVPLDDDLEWLRYHHLFSECVSEVLKQEDPVKFAELHRRAAIWCGENRLITEAVNYANAIGNYELSKQIINDNSEWMIREQFGGEGYFNNLMAEIPEEEITKDPRMLYSRAYTNVLSGNFRQALRYHDAAEVLMKRDGVTPETLRSRLAIGTGLLSAVEFELARDGGWLRDRLELVEGLKIQYPRMSQGLHRLCSVIRQALAIQSVGYGDFDIARSHALAAKVDLEKSYMPVIAIYVEANFGVIELWCNAPDKARQRFKNASEIASKSTNDHSNMKSMGDALLYSIEYWESDLKQDLPPKLENALLRAVNAGGWYDVYSIGFDAIIHDALCREQYDDADALIAKLEESLERLAIQRLTQFSEVLRLNLYATCRAFEQAEQTFKKVKHWLSNNENKMDELVWFQWVAANYASARYLWSIDEFDEALRYVERGIGVSDALNVILMRVRGNVLKASILEAAGNREQAFTVLEQAIEDAACINCPRPFAGDVSQPLLAEVVSSTMNKTQAHAVKDLAPRIATVVDKKLFSSREEEVLQGIVEGKSNKEIARELDLTDNTIKFHLRNIYRKLGVKKRVPAVEKARELGILL